MVNVSTLTTLASLEQEMARAGRSREEDALRDALQALTRPDHGFLSQQQAADRLKVPVSTVERWVERGSLDGGSLGSLTVVSQESVDRIIQLRQILAELDEEGFPTLDEIQRLSDRGRSAPEPLITPPPDV